MRRILSWSSDFFSFSVGWQLLSPRSIFDISQLITNFWRTSRILLNIYHGSLFLIYIFFHAFPEKTRKNYLKWKNKQNLKTGQFETTLNLELTRNTNAGGWSLERPFICYLPFSDVLLTFRHKMTFHNEVDKKCFFKLQKNFNFQPKSSLRIREQNFFKAENCFLKNLISIKGVKMKFKINYYYDKLLLR